MKITQQVISGTFTEVFVSSIISSAHEGQALLYYGRVCDLSTAFTIMTIITKLPFHHLQ